MERRIHCIMEERLEGTDVHNDLSRVVDAFPGLVCTALPDEDIDFLNRRWEVIALSSRRNVFIFNSSQA
jgi:hypothetical protein